MTVIKLLEQLANHTHHAVSVEHLIKDQSTEIRAAFLSKNKVLIQNQFDCESRILADKSVVVHISDN